MTTMPVLAESRSPAHEDSPRLEYDMHLFSEGEVTVRAYLSPTLNYSKNYRNPEGIRFSVSFDDEEPQILNMHEPMVDGFDQQVWNQWAANNINIMESTHTIDEPGQHTLNIWMVDTGVVLQKIMVETEDAGTTYLGPPESFYSKN